MTEPERISPGPFADHLGFRILRADLDGALVEAEPRPEHCNGAGIVHGGYLAALLDSATGWAVHQHVEVGLAAPHIQLTVQYVRIALPGQILQATGRCIVAGRRIASTEAEITYDDRVIARAIASHAVLTN